MDGSITFLTDHEFLPDRAGGRESSIHQLAAALKRAGRSVRVVARGKSTLLHSLYRLSVGFLPDYSIIRTKDPLSWVFAKMNPSETIISSLDNNRIPAFVEKYRGLNGYIYFRDAQYLNQLPHEEINRRFTVLANSEFLARELLKFQLKAHVLPPLICPELYATAATGRYVTFINPVPKKGLHVALEIAKHLSDIPFQFIECWPMAVEEWNKLIRLCADVGNVTLRRRRLDMRKVYRTTRVLLVPSQWDEAWGRVVTEAQFSGIPSVVSDSGALAKVAGRGGIAIERTAPAEVWATAVRSAYSDGHTRDKLREGALLEAAAYIRLGGRTLERLLELLDEARPAGALA